MLTVLMMLLAPFFQNQLPFTLRTTMGLSVCVSHTLAPLTVDKGVDHPHVVGFVAHRDRLTGNLWQTHDFIPVVQPLHRNPARRMHLRLAITRGWASEHDELFGIGEKKVRAPQ